MAQLFALRPDLNVKPIFFRFSRLLVRRFALCRTDGGRIPV